MATMRVILLVVVFLGMHLVVLARVGTAANEPGESNWTEVAREANVAYQEHKFEAAAKLYGAALKAPGIDSQPAGTTIDLLANQAECLAKSKDFVAAGSCLTKCNEMLESNKLDGDPVAIRVLNRRDLLKIRRGDRPGACVDIRLQRLRIAEKLFGERAELVHSYLLPAVESLLDARHYGDAIVMGTHGLKLLEGAELRLAPMYRVELTYRLAMAYAAFGRGKEADECYQQTISYLRNSAGGDKYLPDCLEQYEQVKKVAREQK
jgi:tetratricopeptide (TPR) repeat protein